MKISKKFKYLLGGIGLVSLVGIPTTVALTSCSNSKSLYSDLIGKKVNIYFISDGNIWDAEISYQIITKCVGNQMYVDCYKSDNTLVESAIVNANSIRYILFYNK